MVQKHTDNKDPDSEHGKLVLIFGGPDEDQRTEDQEQRDQPVGRGADIQGARTHHRQPHHAQT